METGSDAGKVFFRASSSAFSSRLRSPLLRSFSCCGPAIIRFSEPPRQVAHYSRPLSRSRTAYSPAPAEQTQRRAHLRHVRFTPESGHVQCSSRCPLWANSGLMQCSKKDCYSIAASARASSEDGMGLVQEDGLIAEHRAGRRHLCDLHSILDDLHGATLEEKQPARL